MKKPGYLRSLCWLRVIVFVPALLAGLETTASTSAQVPNQTQHPVFRIGTEGILVNVVVRDKEGAVVRNLTQDDFAMTEDDRTEAISSFDFEELDRVEPRAAEPQQALLETQKAVLEKRSAGRPAHAPAAALSAPGAPKVDMHGRRLIVFFFDLSSMQPEEIERAVKATHEYVDQKLLAADLIAVASFSTSLRIDQDFTADREALDAAVDALGGASGQGFEGMTGAPESPPDMGAAFTPDDTEFNIFNTARRLEALQSLSDALAGIQQKKSVVYFSSGMSQSGTDNQVQLRRTIDRANRANVSLYAADMRGLQTNVPGADATEASAGGVAAFSGASVSNQVSRLAASQDTLSTMADDTSGRAFFDSNAFRDVVQRVLADTSAYYLLGYLSTNPVRDGRFRRIKVRLTRRTDLKLEYRSGYYAGRDFDHSTREDRDQQLQDQLTSDLSATDLSVYVSTAYFRLDDNRFDVQMSLLVPGYQVPFTKATDKNRSTIEVLGIVRDQQGRLVGRVRDAVRIAAEGADDLKRKTVQYESGLELAPGKYHMKFVVRENQNGTMGSYEADVVVPDLKIDSIKLSSVVIGTQIQEGAHKNDRNPLARNGSELIPNVTHIVSPGQHLYFYYEIYDPARVAGLPGIKVLTSIALFRGGVRVFETPPVEITELNAPDRKTAAFHFELPSASLSPGIYTCQVNVIDDVAGTFSFTRVQLLVRR
jgi:VWFA-related protein